MPIQTIAGPQAFENGRTNAQNSWTPRGTPEDRVGPVARPMFHPSFVLERGEKVFTIGSCFARNVESQLARLGFEVPMRQIRINDEPGDSGVFNNYAAPSILNELEWALDPERPFDPATGLVEVTRNGYCDLHLMRLFKPTSIEQALERRAHIKQGMSSAKDCRVIIITLGLVEAWWDAHAQRYLNITPPKQVVKKSPDRFSLHVLSVEEIRDHLERVLTLLLRFGRPDQKVVLTVSPVPLGLTYTTQDVMVANAYSKSALRVVAEELTNKYEHVDYFPSYESVILSERDLAWQDDNRHVRQNLIDMNVDRMVSAYMGGSGERLIELALTAEKARQFKAAEAFFRESLDTGGGVPAQLGLARCLSVQGRPDDALAVLGAENPTEDTAVTRALVLSAAGRTDDFVALAPRLLEIGSVPALQELLKGSFVLGEYDLTEKAAATLAARSPRNFLPLQYRAMVRLKMAKPKEAVVLLDEAIKLSLNSVRLFTLLGQAHAALGDVAAAKDSYNRALVLNPKWKEALQGVAALG